MAKTRPDASKKRRPKGQGGSANHPRSAAHVRPRSQPPAKSPRELMDDAVAAMTQGDIQVALAAAQKAVAGLEAADSSGSPVSKIVDGVGTGAACSLLGEIYVEAGDIDKARAALERAVNLDPDGSLPDIVGGGVDKFLNMAQLSENGGQDSVDWYKKGAAALRKRISDAEMDGFDANKKGSGEDSAMVTENKHKLAQILCAVAEIWMTDLSYEPDCEAQCESLVTEATLVAPGLPETWQTLANVRISQDRSAEAQTALDRSLKLWEDLPPDHPDIPAFPSRVALVRLLLTINWLDKAAEMLARLLRDDDEAVEVWYLAGYTHYLEGQQLRSVDKQERWKTCWRAARRCLARCKRLFQQQEYEDERLGQHAAELLAEVTAEVGPATEKEELGDADDDEEEEDDGEWEDMAYANEDDDEDDAKGQTVDKEMG